jgi:hypothetical protein
MQTASWDQTACEERATTTTWQAKIHMVSAVMKGVAATTTIWKYLWMKQLKLCSGRGCLVLGLSLAFLQRESHDPTSHLMTTQVTAKLRM